MSNVNTQVEEYLSFMSVEERASYNSAGKREKIVRLFEAREELGALLSQPTYSTVRVNTLTAEVRTLRAELDC